MAYPFRCTCVIFDCSFNSWFVLNLLVECAQSTYTWRLIKNTIYFRRRIFYRSKQPASEITDEFNDRFLWLSCSGISIYISVTTNPNLFPYGCLSRSRYCLSLSFSLSFSVRRQPALRKLINPARNCENTRTFRVENDRSNRTFGTRLLPNIYIYTHTFRRKSPTVIRNLLNLCAFPISLTLLRLSRGDHCTIQVDCRFRKGLEKGKNFRKVVRGKKCQK